MATGGGAPVAYLEPMDQDDGYVSPTFELPDADSEDEADHFVPPAKRARRGDGRKQRDESHMRMGEDNSLAAEEALALKLLSGTA